MSETYSLLVEELVRKFPFLDKNETARMLEEEAEGQRAHSKMQNGRSCSYVIAYDKAKRQIEEWICNPRQYQVDTDSLQDLAAFVASHRRACVPGSAHWTSVLPTYADRLERTIVAQ